MATQKKVTPVSTTTKNSTAKQAVEKTTTKNSTTKPAGEKKTVKNSTANKNVEKSTAKKPTAVKKPSHQLGKDTWKTSYPIVDLAAQPFIPWWVKSALAEKVSTSGKFTYASVYYLLRDLCPDYTDHTVSELLDMLKAYVASNPDTVIGKWFGKELTPSKERDLTARLWWCMATSLKALDEANAQALQAKAEKIASQKAAVQSIAKAALEDAITNDAPAQ